jgi:hypothetical protein
MASLRRRVLVFTAAAPSASLFALSRDHQCTHSASNDLELERMNTLAYSVLVRRIVGCSGCEDVLVGITE